MKEAQKLTCEWPGYVQVLLRLLELSSREHHHIIFIKQTPTSKGRLWFVQVTHANWILLLFHRMCAA